MHNQKRSIQEALGLSTSDDETNPMAEPKPKYAQSKKIDVSKLSVAKTKPKYITVFDLDKELHGEFKKNSLFNNFYITGGVSGIKKYRWAWYFTLDDPKHSKVSMSAEIPYYIARKLPFKFENGMNVDIVAGLAMSRRYGNTQIKVKKILPAGISELYLKAQKTKRELAKAGYFNEDHKKAIPIFPKRVAVITSSKGAVVRDIIDTIRIRFPKVQVVLFPSAVSGANAPKQLVNQIHHIDKVGNFDVAIIGRGGGSKKDLQTFNDKQLAIAIYNCKTPIVSSVGHGIDNEFITNYVADDHEDTPTAAADKVTPVTMKDFISYLKQWHQVILSDIKSTQRDYKSQLTDLEQSPAILHPTKMYQPYNQDLLLILSKLHSGIQQYLENLSQPIIHMSEILAEHSPKAIVKTKIANSELLEQHLQSGIDNYLQSYKNNLLQLDSNVKQINLKQIIINRNDQLNLIGQSLRSAISNDVQHRVNTLDQAIASIKQLSPKQTMKRGFSFITKNGNVVNNANNLSINDKVLLNLYKGKVVAKILKRKPK